MITGQNFLMVKNARPKQKQPPKQWNRLYIAERLDKKTGRSQSWLASAMGYSEPYISLIIGGKRPYNQRIEEAAEAALGVTKGALRHPPSHVEMRQLLHGISPEDRRDLAKALIDALKDT